MSVTIEHIKEVFSKLRPIEPQPRSFVMSEESFEKLKDKITVKRDPDTYPPIPDIPIMLLGIPIRIGTEADVEEGEVFLIIESD